MKHFVFFISCLRQWGQVLWRQNVCLSAFLFLECISETPKDFFYSAHTHPKAVLDFAFDQLFDIQNSLET